MRVRVAVTGAVVAAVALLLVACGSAGPVPSTPVTAYPGEPKGIDAPAYSAGGVPFAVWLDGGAEFAVTLYGTAECPAKATEYRVDAADEVDVAVAGDCPLEYLPYTTVFSTPSSVDTAVTVQFTAQGMHFYLPPVGK